MNCFRHSISICCGNKATRVLVLNGKLIQYCDDCAKDMILLWSGWWVDPTTKEKKSFDWEEASEEALHLMEVMKS